MDAEQNGEPSNLTVNIASDLPKGLGPAQDSEFDNNSDKLKGSDLEKMKNKRVNPATFH